MKKLIEGICSVFLIIGVLSGCQNLNTQSCTHSYTFDSKTSENSSLNFKKNNHECLQISSRIKTYDVLSIVYEVENEEWLNEHMEEIKKYTMEYAADIYKLNNRAETIEAIVISYKKKIDDVQPLKHFEFSAADLSELIK